MAQLQSLAQRRLRQVQQHLRQTALSHLLWQVLVQGNTRTLFSLRERSAVQAQAEITIITIIKKTTAQSAQMLRLRRVTMIQLTASFFQLM